MVIQRPVEVDSVVEQSGKLIGMKRVSDG